MLKKLSLTSLLILSCQITPSLAATPIVTDSVALTQSILQQERKWAGLESKTIEVVAIKSENMIADMFTKALSGPRIAYLLELIDNGLKDVS